MDMGLDMDFVRTIAHVAREAGVDAWREPHDLEEHLLGVAAMAAEFAQGYGAQWADVAARWHDLGKYRPRFQRYIRLAACRT